MKNILLFLALSATILFSSCEGEPGPRVYGKVSEVSVRSYQYDAAYNQLYSSVFSYPFTVYESDVILAYRLSGSDNSVNPPADVWTQLPQSVFYNDGTGDFFQYNFNASFTGIQFTIEGNFPLTNMAPDDATNQVFRIAVVPLEFSRTNPTMEQVLEFMKTNDGDIETIEPLR